MLIQRLWGTGPSKTYQICNYCLYKDRQTYPSAPRKLLRDVVECSRVEGSWVGYNILEVSCHYTIVGKAVVVTVDAWASFTWEMRKLFDPALTLLELSAA